MIRRIPAVLFASPIQLETQTLHNYYLIIFK